MAEKKKIVRLADVGELENILKKTLQRKKQEERSLTSCSVKILQAS
jgi:hypothetical protein